MGAISGTLLSLLSGGDHLVADGCTFALLTETLPRFGIQVDTIDMADMELFKSTIRPDTKMVYFETIANPSMKVIDIEAVAAYAHSVAPDCLWDWKTRRISSLTCGRRLKPRKAEKLGNSPCVSRSNRWTHLSGPCSVSVKKNRRT